MVKKYPTLEKAFEYINFVKHSMFENEVPENLIVNFENHIKNISRVALIIGKMVKGINLKKNWRFYLYYMILEDINLKEKTLEIIL